MDGIDRHPHHRGERYQESHDFCPFWIDVVFAERHRVVGYDVVDENTAHYQGGEDQPTPVPELEWPEANHVLDVVHKLASSIEPGHGHRLEEADPQERHAGGRVEVHDLEQVHSALG